MRTAPFHTLEPLSAVGYAWEYSLGQGAPLELEVQEGLGVGSAEVRECSGFGGGAKVLLFF